MPRAHRAHGPPRKCPDLIPHAVAGCCCSDKPVPSNFPSLSDKGQKSNDRVVDPLAREARQADGALDIREGGELGFHQPPTLFPALNLGVWQPPEVGVWLPLKHERGRLDRVSYACYSVPAGGQGPGKGFTCVVVVNPHNLVLTPFFR